MSLLAAVFALLLCGGAGFALAADGAPDESADIETSSAPAFEQGEEIPSERTATSRTFSLSDGSREARLFNAPVNFRDEEGEWQPIRTDLSEAPSGSGLVNGQNSFDLQLPEAMGDGVVRLSEDDQWVSSKLLGMQADLELVSKNAAAYAVGDGSTTFELTSTMSGVKEKIVLEDPSQPSSFAFHLDASTGLVPDLAADGSISFRDGDGKVFATLPAPTVADAADPHATNTGAVHYSLSEPDEGSWRLVVAVEREWLEAPGREWPVTIDPTLQINSLSLDCEITSLPLEKNKGRCGQDKIEPTPSLRAAFNQVNGQRYRTLLSFDLTAIPAKASVYDATVGLYATEAENPSPLELLQVTQHWDSSTNWIKAGPKDWTTPGGSFSLDGRAEATKSETGTYTGWWNFTSSSFTDLVWRWLNGQATNFGVLIKQSDETKTSECIANSSKCSTRLVSFVSTGAGTPALAPKLTVKYWPVAPVTSKVTLPSEGLRTARRLKLKAQWQVSGVTGISWQFREGKAGRFKTIPPELVKDADAKAVTWPVPTSAATESKPLYFDAAHATPTLQNKGGSVQVRALFEGPMGVEGYSQPVEATINRFLGGPRDATAEVGPGTVDLLTGNFTISRTDVAIPTFNGSLDFSRTYNSRDSGKLEGAGVLGPGWKPGTAVEQSGSGDWRSVKLVDFTENIEGEIYTFTYAIATGVEGAEIGFEKVGERYETPPEAAGWALVKSGSQFILTSPDGTSTKFEDTSGGGEYKPVEIAQAGGTGTSTRMVYEVVGGAMRLKGIVGPYAEGLPCPATIPPTQTGCRGLAFTYAGSSEPGGYGIRLQKVTYYAPSLGGPWDVARYAYDASGRLSEVWDPRISPNNLKESYAYVGTTGLSATLLKEITPPGLKPWSFEYGAIDEEEENGRLMAVKRASLVSSPSTAQATIAYGVPVGASGPYDLSGTQIAKWGQQDIPVDATAIFPPDEVPTSSPPASYSRATVYYMDADGSAVNTVTPQGAGTEAESITTGETDEYGNVIRELTPQNRLRALVATNPVARSEQLDTTWKFGAGGTEMQEEIGPLHQIRLKSGTTTNAQLHKTIQYDEGYSASSPPAGAVQPHLPTRETTGALVGGELLDRRVTEYKYDWRLRKPTETIIDPTWTGPEALNIRSVAAYDYITGLPTERRQPRDAGSAGAGTTKIVYYKGYLPAPGCSSWAWNGLPCKIEPAAQPGTSGQPKTLVKHIIAYNALNQPTEVIERPGGEGATRKSVMTYDDAGRPLTTKVEGAGAAVPKLEMSYNLSTGLPTVQRFNCPSECSNDQKVTTTYDTLGRPFAYKDADDNTSTVNYDLLGRIIFVSDGKGTQTMTYDVPSGLLTKVHDSNAGDFTASYDADGNLVAEGLPNGLVAETTYDETGIPTHLAYNKTTWCSEDCIWFDFAAERSIDGQILAQSSLSSRQEYRYDQAGRLIQTKDWDAPANGSCTTREYKFEGPAGLDSNRTKLVTRNPGVAGACAESGGSEQAYKYDGADRLVEGGVAYDDFGRITSLPASYAGGKVLTSSYFSTDMVASQTQNGVTNTFELDAALRQSRRVQGGGFEGTEVFHYAGGSDTPSWTQFGSKWTRNIPGIGGELAAIRDSSGTRLQLTNLHGDIVATASPLQSAPKSGAVFDYDEFGVPKQEVTPQYGWLGGKGRRTEFASGAIQMGARSYIPIIGRFVSADPIEGGSANPYDYASADPVNGLDLDGFKAKKKKSGSRARSALAPSKRISFSIPNPYNAVRDKLGRMAADAAKKTWNWVKETPNMAKEAILGTPDFVTSTLNAIDRFGKGQNPFAYVPFDKKVACMQGGSEHFLEAMRALTTPAQKVAYVALGCFIGMESERRM